MKALMGKLASRIRRDPKGREELRKAIVNQLDNQEITLSDGTTYIVYSNNSVDHPKEEGGNVMPNITNTYELYRVHYIANEDHPDYPAQEELISSGFTKPQVDAMMKSFRNSDNITGEYIFVSNGEIISTEDNL